MKSILKKCICSIVACATLFGGVIGLFSQKSSVASADVVTETRYYDAPGVMPISGTDETITFARKEETEIVFPNAVPNYFTSDYDNACGPVAGANIVGFYDKYYEDLIPGYTAYYPANGRYRRPDATYVPALIGDLYTLMQTNVWGIGVSETECLNGLQTYVQGKNRSLSYTNLKPLAFDLTAYKNAISNNKPVLLFCATTEVYDIATSDVQDEILFMMSSNAHIVVGYGYYEIKYYDANDVNFRTDVYLEVATGWLTTSSGYLKANNSFWLNGAYAVNIT
ncbi:MAG: hypothetical protein E7352_05705 [Clostridiales bacterium]|nr:hypothetical protein [Clostridiales bacterium]MBE5747646.1 hypothetical protein [Clostridiales bacterium]